MKRIKYLVFAACVLAGIASCETYKVQDPEMTAVSEFDGKWVCFGVDEAGDTAVYFIEITNDTYNSSDKLWMTVVNNDPGVGNALFGAPYGYYYLDAIRFKVNCNNSNLTFQCDSTEAIAPYLVNNEYLAQTYYTIGYGAFDEKNCVMGKALVEGGKVTPNAIATGGNQKASAIEFALSRNDVILGKSVVEMKGMKITGWYDDMAEYVDFMYENYPW